MKSSSDLKTMLASIHRKSYPAYKDLRGIYSFGDYTLSIDHGNRRRQGNRIADHTVRTAALCDSGPSSRYKIYSSAGKQRCI